MQFMTAHESSISATLTTRKVFVFLFAVYYRCQQKRYAYWSSSPEHHFIFSFSIHMFSSYFAISVDINCRT